MKIQILKFQSFGMFRRYRQAFSLEASRIQQIATILIAETTLDLLWDRVRQVLIECNGIAHADEHTISRVRQEIGGEWDIATLATTHHTPIFIQVWTQVDENRIAIFDNKSKTLLILEYV